VTGTTIPLSAPDITEREIKVVATVLRSPWMSGAEVREICNLDGNLCRWGKFRDFGAAFGVAGVPPLQSQHKAQIERVGAALRCVLRAAG